MGSAQQLGHLITHQADLLSFLRWCTSRHDAANTTERRTPRLTSFERGATNYPWFLSPTTGQRDQVSYRRGQRKGRSAAARAVRNTATPSPPDSVKSG
jgi:hypothetical protein